MLKRQAGNSKEDREKPEGREEYHPEQETTCPC